MSRNESIAEDAALEWFGELGYGVGHGPHLAPGEAAAERDSFGNVVLVGRLREGIGRLNPGVPEDAREEALRRVLRVGAGSLTQTNRAFHTMLRDGVAVEYRRSDGSIAGEAVRLMDFEERFDALDQNQRLTLAAAASEQVITQARVREMTGLHPFDATRLLQDLVQQKYLEAHSQGKGAVYCLPGTRIARPEDVFGGSSEHLGVDSEHFPPSSAHLPDAEGGSGGPRDAYGHLLSPQVDGPVIDSLDRLTPAFRAELERLASVPRTKKKVAPEAMRETVLTLCRGDYMALGSLSELVNRDPDALRQQHLRPLVNAGDLRLAFPTAPTHAKQAYRAKDNPQQAHGPRTLQSARAHFCQDG